jgi:site-specific DNA-adenine methylase
MSYQGGKQRLGKKIHDSIIDIENQLTDVKLPYFEPFVGMGGVMRHFAQDNNRELYACDKNTDIILMWQAMQEGWKPPSACSKEQYNQLKQSNKPSAERGFVGSICSFGGNFFHAYRRSRIYSDYDDTNRGSLKVQQLAKEMKKVHFLSAQSYTEFDPQNMLIYCDPPYSKNKLSNKYFQNFDHQEFWTLMRNWSKNNIVIVSELSAPNDFIPIWKQPYEIYFNTSDHTDDSIKKKYVEQLFIFDVQ